MDDSAKQAQNQDDQQQVAPQSDGASTPASPAGGSTGQPSVPISGPHKEAAPLTGQASEYLHPAEAKPELSREVAEAGVEHASEEKPHIPHEVGQAGVIHAKESVSHPTEPIGVVSFPQVTQQQAQVMKKSPVRDAARWFATLVIRQFDKIAYQKLPTK